MKRFPGQASNEDLLYLGREHPVSFVVNMSTSLFSSFATITLIRLILFFFNNIAGGALAIVLYLCRGAFFFHYYHESYLIISNKRVLKHIRDGLFSHHMKEISLKNVDEVYYTSQGLLNKIFRFGNINAGGKTEQTILWFRGIPHCKQVTLYLSRVRDHIREHPEEVVPSISPFTKRSKRKKQETTSQ